MYLWQGGGRCLIRHFENPRRQGNAEVAQEWGQRCCYPGTLHNGLSVHPVAHHLQLVQRMANRPPRLLTPELRRPFQQQCQHTELHLGDDPTRPPMSPDFRKRKLTHNGAKVPDESTESRKGHCEVFFPLPLATAESHCTAL